MACNVSICTTLIATSITGHRPWISPGVWIIARLSCPHHGNIGRDFPLFPPRLLAPAELDWARRPAVGFRLSMCCPSWCSPAFSSRTTDPDLVRNISTSRRCSTRRHTKKLNPSATNQMAGLKAEHSCRVIKEGFPTRGRPEGCHLTGCRFLVFASPPLSSGGKLQLAAEISSWVLEESRSFVRCDQRTRGAVQLGHPFPTAAWPSGLLTPPT
jgi:hypothetical protein